MGKNFKNVSKVIFAALTIFFIIIVAYNLLCNRVDFLKTSAISCLTLFVAVVVSYFLAQRQNDERKRKDVIEGILSRLQEDIRKKDAYIITDDFDKDDFNMKKRDINNRITLLEERLNQTDEEKINIQFLKKTFGEYQDLVGNHIDDIDYLTKSPKELKRPLLLLDGKIYEMILNLYS